MYVYYTVVNIIIQKQKYQIDVYVYELKNKQLL